MVAEILHLTIVKMMAVCHLGFFASSAKLPTGLYILPSVISSFFTMSKAIPGSTRQIITIFSPYGRYLREFSRSGLVLKIPQGTLLRCTYSSGILKWNGILLPQWEH